MRFEIPTSARPSAEFCAGATASHKAFTSACGKNRIHIACDWGMKNDAQAHANRPRMKQDIEELLQRYPHSAWNMNGFAAFACRAGDGETFRNLRFRIANVVVERAWPSNLSIDVCEAKFGAKAS
jgi:hypothetical protein